MRQLSSSRMRAAGAGPGGQGVEVEEPRDSGEPGHRPRRGDIRRGDEAGLGDSGREQRLARLVHRRPEHARFRLGREPGSELRLCTGQLRRERLDARAHVTVAAEVDLTAPGDRDRRQRDLLRTLERERGERRGTGDRDAPRVGQALHRRETDPEPGEAPGSEAHRESADVRQAQAGAGEQPEERSRQEVADPRRRPVPFGPYRLGSACRSDGEGERQGGAVQGDDHREALLLCAVCPGDATARSSPG